MEFGEVCDEAVEVRGDIPRGEGDGGGEVFDCDVEETGLVADGSVIDVGCGGEGGGGDGKGKGVQGGLGGESADVEKALVEVLCVLWRRFR